MLPTEETLHSCLHDALPIGYCTLNRQGVITDINLKAAELLGIERHLLIKTYLINYLHPDSHESFHHHLYQVVQQVVTKRCHVKIAKVDHFFYAQIDTAPVCDQQKIVQHFHVILQDTTEQQTILYSKERTEQTLQTRDAILEAVNFAAQQFLTTTGWEQHIQQVLERLGKATRASRVYIFKNEYEHVVLMNQIYEWISTHFVAQRVHPLHKLPYHSFFSDWAYKLSHGQSICGITRYFTLSQIQFFIHPNALSIALVPIFANEQWWGFIGYDDFLAERQWLPTVIEALKVSANLLGAAIYHKEIQQSLHRSKERIWTLIDSTDDLICYWELNGTPYPLTTITAQKMGFPAIGCTSPTWREQIYPDDLLQIEQFFAVHPQGCALFEQEYRLRLSSNSWHWFHSRMVGIKNQQGIYTGYNSISRDITQLKQTEALLRTQRDLSIALSTTNHLQKALEQLLYQLCQIEGLDCGGIYLIDEFTGNLVLTVHHGLSPEFVQQVTFYHANSMHAQLIKTGKPIYEQYINLLINQDSYQQEQLQAIAIIPILEEKQIVAVLNLASHTHTDIPLNTRNVLESTANQISSTIARIKVEKALQDNEERLKLVLEGNNDGFWDWNIATGSLLVSKQWAEMLGHRLEEIEPHVRSWQKRVHPEDMPRVMIEVEKHLQGQTERYETEFRFLNKAGDWQWILARAKVVNRNTQGQALRMAGTHTDITHRRQTEDALRVSEQYRRTLIETALVGLLLLDLQGEIREVNPAFANMIGYRSEELINHFTYWELMPEKYIDAEKKYLFCLTPGKQCGPFYKEFIHKQGHLIPTRMSGLVLEYQGEHFVWCNIEDITEQKRTEAALRKAKEIAEVANNAKNIFLANMSHELRTPLNAILGYAQILRGDEQFSTQQKEGIQIIQRNGEYLLTLINDILDIAKIEVGRIELQPIDFDLLDFLKSIIDLFDLRARHKQITFEYKLSPHLPKTVYADEKRLRQVLINLLSNAIKFTDKGMITFSVTHDKSLQQPMVEHIHYLQFSVEDTGTGIAESDLDKIFLPFQRLNQRKYWTEGTGLGLSISKNLVEMMGSELHVTSQLGQGCRFWMTLALPESTTNSPQSIEVRKIIGYKIPNQLTKKYYRILVVDDKLENQTLLTNMLSPLHFEVLTASNGQEAIQQTITYSPDLILMDIVMPILDGLEATHQIKQHGIKIPIIAISANTFIYHQQKSIEIGCQDFLPKPIHPTALLDCIHRYLPLNWIYEETPQLEEIITVGPTANQASILLDLALSGDINGIIHYVEQLMQNDRQLTAFSNKIIQLAKKLQEKEICEIAKYYTEQIK